MPPDRSERGGEFTGLRGDPRIRQVILKDTLMTAARTIGAIAPKEESEFAEFDALAAAAAAVGMAPGVLALEEERKLSSATTTTLLLQLLVSWVAGQAATPDWHVLGLQTTWIAKDQPRNPADRVLAGLLSALLDVGAVGDPAGAGDEAALEAAGKFLDLARRLDGLGQADAALGCAQTAANLAGMLEGPAARALVKEASELALRFARRDGATRVVVGELFRRCHELAAGTGNDRDDDGTRLVVFDAFEAALRRLHLGVGELPNSFATLRRWLRDLDYLRPLQLYLWRLLPPGERADLAPEVIPVELSLTPVWEGTTDEWSPRLLPLLNWAKLVEEHRLQLRPATPATARFVPETGSIEHFLLQAAVPNADSILNGPNSQQLLLQLGHEVAHVYSLMGHVGNALWAARWMLFEAEVELWIRATEPDAGDDHVIERFLEEARPARIPQPDWLDRPPEQHLPLVLASLERQLHLERKIQVLERTWNSWWEGIALFGELAADPRDDADSFSPVAGVVANLRDLSVRALVEERQSDPESMIRGVWREAEETYGRAREAEGRYQLRVYLGADFRKYLPGYLAVRSVVAAWRNRLEVPCSGAEAFALLLQLTRFTGPEVIPPLDLPLDQFAAEARRRHLAWVASLTCIPAEDLLAMDRNVTGHAAKPFTYRWEGGQMHQVTDDQDTRHQEIARLVEYVSQGLAWPDAGSSRTSGDPAWRQVRQVAMDALAGSSTLPRFLTAESLNGLFSERAVLPLARVESPFWIAPAQKQIISLIRTRERSDAESGTGAASPLDSNAGYAVRVFPLSDADLTAITRELNSGGPSRLQLTRVAYLAPDHGGEPSGSQYLVYQYGDWLKIDPAGIFSDLEQPGSTVQWCCESRYRSDPVKRAQRALTAAHHPLARRSLDWLGQIEPEIPIGPETVSLEPWILDLQALVGQILAGSEEEDGRLTAIGLLHFVLGDAAETWWQSGFETLRREDPALYSALIELFDRSGRTPVPTAEVDPILPASPHPLAHLGRHGWDLPPPKTIPPPPS